MSEQRRSLPDPGWGAAARRWLARYAPAEVAAILGSYCGYGGAIALGGGLAAAAYAAAWCENIGFYLVMALRDWRAAGAGQRRRALLNLVMEFGAAELIDSFIVRPGAMALAIVVLGPALGILVGKLTADAVFYLLAIAAHERLRRRGAMP